MGKTAFLSHFLTFKSTFIRYFPPVAHAFTLSRFFPECRPK